MVNIGATVGRTTRIRVFAAGGRGMRNRLLLGAGIALAAALSWANAQAQLMPAPGTPGAWYFGGEGGWTDLESPQTGTAAHKGFSQNFDTGFNVGIRGGYEWGPWRFE